MFQKWSPRVTLTGKKYVTLNNELIKGFFSVQSQFGNILVSKNIYDKCINETNIQYSSEKTILVWKLLCTVTDT